mgnify:CR=1 FL=1
MLTLASFGKRDSTQRRSLNARLLSGTKSLSGWSSDLMFMKPNVHRALINNANAIVVQGFVETQVATFAVPAAMPWSTAAAARWSAVGCSDRAQSAETRKSFLDRYCETDTLVMTGHFPSPSVGHVCRHGDGFDFEFSAV